MKPLQSLFLAKRRQAPSEPGFTLLEVLIVVAIIAVLAALLVPGLKNLRNGANRAKCQSNLRQIVLAGISYTMDHNGYFPRISARTPVNPFKAGGWPMPSDPGAGRPLNEYVDDKFDLFRCPADTVPYVPEPGAAAWASKPFYESFGTSYFYNSYVTPYASAFPSDPAEPPNTGLHNLRLQQIKSPTRMVFFADQDARVIAYNPGGNWKRLTLWWHAPRGGQLRANVAFVDGSVRLVDVVDAEEAEFTFYNE